MKVWVSLDYDYEIAPRTFTTKEAAIVAAREYFTDSEPTEPRELSSDVVIIEEVDGACGFTIHATELE